MEVFAHIIFYIALRLSTFGFTQFSCYSSLAALYHLLIPLSLKLQTKMIIDPHYKSLMSSRLSDIEILPLFNKWNDIKCTKDSLYLYIPTWNLLNITNVLLPLRLWAWRIMIEWEEDMHINILIAIAWPSLI